MENQFENLIDIGEAVVAPPEQQTPQVEPQTPLQQSEQPIRSKFAIFMDDLLIKLAWSIPLLYTLYGFGLLVQYYGTILINHLAVMSSYEYWFPKPIDHVQEVVDTFEASVEETRQYLILTFWRIGYVIHRFGILTVAFVVLLILAWFTVRWSIKRIFSKQNFYRLRGIEIYQEAEIEGSTLYRAAGMRPSCQIGIFSPGAFSDTHIGFGLRVSSNVMVLPSHVWDRVVELGLVQVGFQGSLKKMIVPVKNATPAACLQDVVFLNYSEEIFSQLGASIGKLSTEIPTSGKIVQVVGINNGVEKMSKGTIKKTNLNDWAYSYDGSTLPGYSGAAYHSGNTIYGMHAWADPLKTKNYGIASKAIAMELSYIVTEEDTQSEMVRNMSQRAKTTMTSSRNVDQSYEDLDMQLKKFYSQNRQKKNVTTGVDWSLEDGLSVSQRNAMTAILSLDEEGLQKVISLLTNTTTLNGQNDDQPEIVLEKNSIFDNFEETILQAVADTLLANNEDFVLLSEYEKDVLHLKGRISTLEQTDRLEEILKRLETLEKNFDFEEIKQRLEKLEQEPEQKIENPVIKPQKPEETSEEVVRAVPCPIKGCNRLFKTITAAKLHQQTAPKHINERKFEPIEVEVPTETIKVGSDNKLEVESAWKSDHDRLLNLKPVFRRPETSQPRNVRNYQRVSNSKLKELGYTLHQRFQGNTRSQKK